MKLCSPLSKNNSIPSSSICIEHLKVFNTKMRIDSSSQPRAGCQALSRIQSACRIFFQLNMGQKSREVGSGEKTVNVLRNSQLLFTKALSVHLLCPDRSIHSVFPELRALPLVLRSPQRGTYGAAGTVVLRKCSI